MLPLRIKQIFCSRQSAAIDFNETRTGDNDFLHEKLNSCSAITILRSPVSGSLTVEPTAEVQAALNRVTEKIKKAEENARLQFTPEQLGRHKGIVILYPTVARSVTGMEVLPETVQALHDIKDKIEKAKRPKRIAAIRATGRILSAA